MPRIRERQETHNGKRQDIAFRILNVLTLCSSVVAVIASLHHYLEHLIRLSYALSWVIGIYKGVRNLFFQWIPIHIPVWTKDCLIALGFMFCAVNFHTLWRGRGNFFQAINSRRRTVPQDMHSRLSWSNKVGVWRASAISVFAEARSTIAWCLGSVAVILLLNEGLLRAIPVLEGMEKDPCVIAWKEANAQMLEQCRGDDR